MTRRPFTRIEETRLVNSIRRFPQIYDYKHREYKNQDLRDDIWARISEDVGRNVEDCKKRWRSIRDTNNRLKRDRKVSGKKNPSKWILADQLGFLERKEPNERLKTENPVLPNVEDRVPEPSEETFENRNDRQERESFEREESRPPTPNLLPVRVSVPKSRFPRCVYRTEQGGSESGEKSGSEEDPVDVFFKSMALSVKRLPPVLIAEAKSRICKTVTDLEIRALLSPSEVVSIVTQDHYQEQDDIKDQGNV